MSTTNMRSRIRTHHVTPKKDWFGVLFAIPVASTILIQALEAELIRLVEEAAGRRRGSRRANRTIR